MLTGDDGETKRTNEIGVAIPLLDQLGDLAGKTVTADALLTQTAIASYLRKHDAHYMFVAKDNQKTLLNDIRLWFHDDAKRPPDFAHTTGKPINGKLPTAHGRWEQREISSRAKVDHHRAQRLSPVPRRRAGLRRDCLDGVVEPGAQLVEHRDALGVAGEVAIVGGLVANAALDGIQRSDLLQRVECAPRLRRRIRRQLLRIEPEAFENVDAPAPSVRPAGQMDQPLLAYGRTIRHEPGHGCQRNGRTREWRSGADCGSAPSNRGFPQDGRGSRAGAWR